MFHKSYHILGKIFPFVLHHPKDYVSDLRAMPLLSFTAWGLNIKLNQNMRPHVYSTIVPPLCITVD